MSELTNANDRTDFRWRLLTTVSAAALLTSACMFHRAEAADGDSAHPSVWIELGGQLAGQQERTEAFLPPFLLSTPRPPFNATSPAGIEKAPASSWDGSAKISFEPLGTDWVLSASVRYGTNGRNDSWNQKTAHLSSAGFQAFNDAYQRITARSTESHAILNFQAGKDVGLGLLGSNGSSILSAGLRYAQFNSKSDDRIVSQPTNIATFYGSFHKFNASLIEKRKFSGIGPSLSWDASTSLIGDPSEGRITLDWGVTGAVLFGRQHAQAHHQTTNILYVPYTHGSAGVPTLVYHHAASPSRSRQVTVPNLGGFAAVSWRYPNAKVSIGYRADMFFGAMDGGIDTAKSYDRGFFGPYASVSIGLGR